MLVVALVVALVAAVAWRSTLQAQARAVVVVAMLLELPVLHPLVTSLTEAGVQRDVRVAGLQARVFQPDGEGPWPGVVFITGADAAGRESEDVAELGRALARAGYVTIVPDLPGLAQGMVGDSTLEAAGETLVAAGRLPQVRGERIAVASVSAGASLAILAASRPQVAPDISVVAGVAPFARVRTVLQIAVTGGFVSRQGEVERYEAEGWLREAVAASLFQATSGSPVLEAIEARLLAQEDPLAAAAAFDARLLPDGAPRRVLELLQSRDPQQFDERYEALPAQVRTAVDQLSPLSVVDRLAAPLELASAPRDRYFPLEESQLLADAAPRGRLTTTGALDHANPQPGLGDTGDLLAFNAFVVRVLRAADERSTPSGG